MKAWLLPFIKLAGRQTLFWLIISVLGSTVLGAVEYGIAISLQLFMKTLGLVNIPVASFFGLTFPSTGSFLIILIVSIAVIRVMGQVLVNQAGTNASEALGLRLRTSVLEDLLFHSAWGKNLPASAIHSLFSENFPKSASFFQGLSQVSSIAIQGLYLIIIMLFLTPQESLLALLSIFAIGLLVVFFNKKITKYANMMPIRNEEMTRGIERVVRNLLLIRLYRSETDELKHNRVSMVGYSASTRRSAFFNFLSSSMAPFLGILTVIAIITISMTWWPSHKGNLLPFLYLFIRFVQVLSAGVNQIGTVGQTWPQVRKVLQWQSVRPTKKTIADKTEEETTNQLRSSPVIKVKDLYYYYDEAKPIFKKLSLTVASGGQLGLVGPSGCGKSTLLLLLTGIITPRAGKITYHFDDLEVSPTQLKIGYVGAEPFLVMGSLLENLLYGWKGPLPTKEEIKKSLLQVSMGEYANKLEMSIGEGGEGLSAGQKQRVCLARALLRKPSLLVLDEATANLDRATEAGIMQVLKNQKGKMTQIIVSHRKETLVHADVILDLKSKK